ncbi:MAG: hypothetical protein DWH96_07925 [Planctomycetota bacterium]|nr:MAG: hypothetical protein DWH96_07925 [Planctomycetota bacterium]RLS93268.1 MAG: hypothetical protein DWI11_07325 [Planctomycetota bacterium]
MMQSDKVIDAHEIESLTGDIDALRPPRKLRARVLAPTIVRMTPKLSFRREAIRRNTREHFWSTLCVEAKQSWMRHAICAVADDEDGHIADESHATTRCMLAQHAPLHIKCKLHERVVLRALTKKREPVREP